MKKCSNLINLPANLEVEVGWGVWCGGVWRCVEVVWWGMEVCGGVWRWCEEVVWRGVQGSTVRVFHSHLRLKIGMCELEK